MHYYLEHSYRWLRGDALHSELFRLPTFYPKGGFAAVSDTLISATPFYSVWRALGFDSFRSYQLWLLGICCLNFATLWLFLRRGFAARTWTASVCAYLLIVQVSTARIHPQLLPLFYLFIAALALVHIFKATAEAKNKNRVRMCSAIFFASGYFC